MFRKLSAPAALEALLAALDHAGIGCTAAIEADGTRERVYVSAPFATMLGLDREAALALPIAATLDPEDRRRVQEFLASSGAPAGASIDATLQRPDGTTLPVELRMTTVPLKTGRLLIAFFHDRTTKVAMETALRESEERFRLVAEASPDSISIFSAGRYVYANPIAMEILGIRSQEELARVDPLARVPPEQLGPMRARSERLARGEKIEPMQFRVPPREPGGAERIVEASISMGRLGGERAILSYARDITERVRLQAEVMKRDRLASVGMLAAGVAHELNNPLTALSLQAAHLTTLADRQSLPDEVKDGLAQIDDAARRMRAIITDLLFMSRPTEQPQAHIDLSTILTSTVALVRAGHPVPAIGVAIEPLPNIEGYASKLGQLFLNILLNAREAVEGRADAVVDVTARLVGDRVEVRIRDSGPGIPAHLVPAVTQPFFTTKPHGTGLGLWISNSIVVQHGGTLDVASAEGQGTTVTVVLPTRLPT